MAGEVSAAQHDFLAIGQNNRSGLSEHDSRAPMTSLRSTTPSLAHAAQAARSNADSGTYVHCSLQELFGRASLLNNTDSGIELSPTSEKQSFGRSYNSQQQQQQRTPLNNAAQHPFNAHPFTPLSVPQSEQQRPNTPLSALFPPVASDPNMSTCSLAFNQPLPVLNGVPSFPVIHFQLPKAPAVSNPGRVTPLPHPEQQQPYGDSLARLTDLITQILTREPNLVPLLRKLLQEGSLEQALINGPLPRLTQNGFDPASAQALFTDILHGSVGGVGAVGDPPVMHGGAGLQQPQQLPKPAPPPHKHTTKTFRSAHKPAQDAACVWSSGGGSQADEGAIFSCKLFVGGVPWDITDEALTRCFERYGPCRIEWPGKDVRVNRSPGKPLPPRGKATGYVYIVYEQEYSVRGVLDDCSQQFGFAGDWYFKLGADRARTHEIRQVQIIPWVLSDAAYVHDGSRQPVPNKQGHTVFVGALHGMVTAEILACVMSDLFGQVLYAHIDTDRHKYPIGSGRVTFASHDAYLAAIRAAFVEIKTAKFSKRVQIDPFLEDTCCSVCQRQPGPYFCRDECCFKYYCTVCWQTHHGQSARLHRHKPLMRNARRLQLPNDDDQESSGSPCEPASWGGLGMYD